MDKLSQSYGEHGFHLLSQVIPTDWLDDLLRKYMGLVREVTGQPFHDPNGADLITFYKRHPEIESKIYLDIRRTYWLEEFSRHPAIVGPVRRLLGSRVGLFRKIPFRIDLPFLTDELAQWHQDFFYVKGNTEVVTAWVPLQRTTFLNGCLSVMPGSHRFGPVDHDLAIGKKRVPSTIFGNEIRMIEMSKGDVLLFNSLLLHSGNLNMSQGIRYSVQPRYTRIDAPAHDEMGGVVAIEEEG